MEFSPWGWTLHEAASSKILDEFPESWGEWLRLGFSTTQYPPMKSLALLLFNGLCMEFSMRVDTGWLSRVSRGECLGARCTRCWQESLCRSLLPGGSKGCQSLSGAEVIIRRVVYFINEVLIEQWHKETCALDEVWQEPCSTHTMFNTFLPNGI